MNGNDLSSIDFSLVVLLLLLGGYAVGLLLRRFLPQAHRTHESLEIVHAVIGMLVAMGAILLGLQLDSSKRSFDGVVELVDRYSIEIIQLDDLLRDYGPEAKPARALLATYTRDATQALVREEEIESRPQGETLRRFASTVRELVPANPVQTRLQSDSLTLVNEIFHERWELITKSRLAPVVPLYGVLVFWIFVAYVAFGINAEFNAPAFLALLMAAVAVAAALFVLSDMETPFDGLIKVPVAPMQDAVRRLSE